LQQHLEWIIAGIPLLSATITFFIKFIKNAKARKNAEHNNLKRDYVLEAVRNTEHFGKNSKSMTKKEVALHKVRKACLDAKIKFKEDEI